MILRLPQPLTSFHFHRPRFIFLGIVILPLVLASGFLQFTRPLPPVSVNDVLQPDSLPPSQVNFPWPGTGAAAVAVDGLGQIASYRDDKQRSLASLVKVMTAYVVLKDHPLRAGEKGAEVQVSADDVNTYRAELANGESVVLVKEGETINELELLQGMLVPSANNMAFMLAQWSSGSIDEFVKRMNDEAAALGMKNTRYVDPSGAAAASVSTASEQLILAQAAMANPIFAQIVAAKQASLPVVGTVFNVNALLARPGMVGIKTGWTEEAGGCFLFAADAQVDGRPVRVFGAVMGQDILADAFNSSQALIPVLAANLHVVKVATQDAPAANLRAKWGSDTPVTFPKDVEFVLWPGTPVDSHIVMDAQPRAPVNKGTQVASIVVVAGSQTQTLPLKTDTKVGKPSLSWRLTRLWS